MTWAWVAGIAFVASTGATLEEGRRGRKSAEILAREQASREKRQLEKEEKTLEESKISARQASLAEKRKQTLRRGQAATTIAGKAIAPNLSRLAEARKKELGTGA